VTDRRTGEAANAGLGHTALETEVLGSPTRIPQRVATLPPGRAGVALPYLEHGEPQLPREPPFRLDPLAEIILGIRRDRHQRIDRGLVRSTDNPVSRVALVLVAEKRG
jgi:hypothetical protein